MSIESTERTPLIADNGLQYRDVFNEQPHHDACNDNTLPIPDGEEQEDSVARFLPISFLGSLGMAATLATTIYAYADLLCADPTNCQEYEQGTYIAVVAMASGLAHTVAILALGPLEKLISRRLKAGLALWIICRATSVIFLVIGVALHNVWIAVAGRVFEGVASDNLLHFNLNTIYVSVPAVEQGKSSRLIGASLGLYLLGSAVAPVAVNVFPTYQTSFIAALTVFGITFAYLCFGIRRKPASGHTANYDGQLSLGMILSPLQPFFDYPSTIPHGLSILLYTVVQAHLFPVIMVFASIHFRFDSSRNGQLVSIAAACAAIQLWLALYLWPTVRQLCQPKGDRSESSQLRGTFTALAMLVQTISICSLSRVTSSAQLYVAVVFISTGLSVPSFLKSHLVSFVSEPARTITGLALMESIGGLVSPFLLGTLQTLYPGQSVFIFAASLMMVSLTLFLVGSVLLHSRRRKEEQSRQQD